MYENTGCIMLSSQDLDRFLRQGPTEGMHTIHGFDEFASNNDLPINLVEIHHAEGALYEVHRKHNDIFICLEGKVSLELGGVLVDPYYKRIGEVGIDHAEVRAKKAQKTRRQVLQTRDVLYIPAGTSHRLIAKNFTARILIIKQLVKPVAISKIPGCENISKELS